MLQRRSGVRLGTETSVIAGQVERVVAFDFYQANMGPLFLQIQVGTHLSFIKTTYVLYIEAFL